MRVLLIGLLFAVPALAQDLEIAVRPDTVYVEPIGGSIVPMERVFFHLIVRNLSQRRVNIQWVRFDLVSTNGALISGQYSGPALSALFDSAVDRRRIEPTAKDTNILGPDERKAISDVFLDFPKGFAGDSLVVEVDYNANDKTYSQKISTTLHRMDGFVGRLPFDGIWYVVAEHSSLDAHKRFLAEAFAYDFLQIGTNGTSHQSDGTRNADYYAYGKKVLAAKDGTVVYVRSDVDENTPGKPNKDAPGGNIVIIDHGNKQYGYYAHLRPARVTARVGMQIRAGEPLGEVGNSGDSLEPHLHFHVMNDPDPAQADGVPVEFESWRAQAYSQEPVERQQGVLPRGEFVEP
jgi:hypothetical protein